MKIELHSIGVIRSPFTELDGMPIQPSGAAGIEGTVVVDSEYQDGLKDLDGFSHIVLMYYFHKSAGYRLSVVPYLDTEPHGLFATRAPRRPNGIGLSVVELISIDGATLRIRNVDILDGTPLLDIKPYVPDFDSVTEIRTGWLEKAARNARNRRSDDRFK